MRRAFILASFFLLPTTAFGQSGSGIGLGHNIIIYNDSRGQTGAGIEIGGGVSTYSDSQGSTGTMIDPRTELNSSGAPPLPGAPLIPTQPIQDDQPSESRSHQAASSESSLQPMNRGREGQ